MCPAIEGCCYAISWHLRFEISGWSLTCGTVLRHQNSAKNYLVLQNIQNVNQAATNLTKINLIYMAYKVKSLNSSIRWFFHILIFWLAKKIDTFSLHLTRGCPSKNTTTIIASSFAHQNNIEWSGRLDAFTQLQFCATKPWRNRDWYKQRKSSEKHSWYFRRGKYIPFLSCSANQLIKNKRPDYLASFFCGDKIEITICVRWKILKGISRLLNRYRRGSSVYSTLTRLYLLSVTSCAATILHSG
jgi:hypothetical protein